MAKITPVLMQHKQNGNGRSPIYLRLSSGDKTKYKSLGYRIKETHWNERSRRVRKSHEKHAEINALIRSKLSEADDFILSRKRAGKPVTARFLKQSFVEAEKEAEQKEASEDKGRGDEEGEEPENDYFAFADKVIERFERRGQIYTHKRYKSCIKKFRKYTGEPFPFDEITPELLEDYETHLIQHYGNAQTTVAANFAAIRAILYKAMARDLAAQSENPFFKFKVKQGTPDRDHLTEEQLARIENLSLPKGSLIWRARSYFLFSTYCAGVRFGDMAKMKRRHVSGGRLRYQMSKTGNQKDMKLLPQAREIALHYLPESASLDRSIEGPEKRLFPIIDGYDTSTPRKMVNAISAQNTLVNKYLKKIAGRVDLDVHLSTHVARHTFASMALREGWDVGKIKNDLRHSDLKTTQTYLADFDEDDNYDERQELFGDAPGDDPDDDSSDESPSDDGSSDDEPDDELPEEG